MLVYQEVAEKETLKNTYNYGILTNGYAITQISKPCGDIWKCNCVTEMIFFSLFFVSWTYFSIFSVTKAQEYCPIVWFTIEKNRMRKSLTVFRWDAWEILLWCDMINLHSYNIQCSSLNIISNNDHMML